MDSGFINVLPNCLVYQLKASSTFSINKVGKARKGKEKGVEKN